MNLVTVIPPQSEEGGCTRAQGTEVRLADGSKLEGVIKVVLTAEVGDLWRAEIHCHANVGVMPSMLVSIPSWRMAWWRSLLCRLAGVEIEATPLDVARSRQWRKP